MSPLYPGLELPCLGLLCLESALCALSQKTAAPGLSPPEAALLLADEAFAFCSLSPSILPPLYCSPLASSSPVLTPYPVTRWENGGPEDLRAPTPCTQGAVQSGAPHVLTAVCGLCQERQRQLGRAAGPAGSAQRSPALRGVSLRGRWPSGVWARLWLWGPGLCSQLCLELLLVACPLPCASFSPFSGEWLDLVPVRVIPTPCSALG